MQNQVFVIAALMVLALMFLMMMFAKLFRKAGPHEAIIVYGFRGTRVVKGRGTVIFPMVESARGLSLELMSFDVAPKQDLYLSLIHISEPTRLGMISYAVFSLKKKNK